MNLSPKALSPEMIRPSATPGVAAAPAMTTDPPDPSRPPDPEVPGRAQRRQFSAQEKLRILRLVDECKQYGEIAALMRREGIYASLLQKWRALRDRGAFEALEDRDRGRKPAPKNPLSGKVKDLEREVRRLQRKLRRAELIMDIQKKLPFSWGSP